MLAEAGVRQVSVLGGAGGLRLRRKPIVDDGEDAVERQGEARVIGGVVVRAAEDLPACMEPEQGRERAIEDCGAEQDDVEQRSVPAASEACVRC